MAIALDHSSFGAFNAGVISQTFSYTCNGTNRILFIGVVGDITNDKITTVTYGSVSMTLVGKIVTPAERFIYLYSLVNPASGSNSCVISASGTTDIASVAISYTGAKQTSNPDNQTTNTVPSATTLTTSLVTGNDNDWTVLWMKTNANPPTASTGSTVRQITGSAGLFDSNAAITPAASYSMSVNASPAEGMASIMASFAPASAVTSGSNSNKNYIAVSVSL